MKGREDKARDVKESKTPQKALMVVLNSSKSRVVAPKNTPVFLLNCIKIRLIYAIKADLECLNTMATITRVVLIITNWISMATKLKAARRISFQMTLKRQNSLTKMIREAIDPELGVKDPR